MKVRRMDEKYIIRIDPGEEIIETLKRVCEEKNIKLGTVTGIGSTNNLKIARYDDEKKEYVYKDLKGKYEITSLLGNIFQMDNKAYIHLHINLSDENFNALGGHLVNAYVSSTCELVLDRIEGYVDRIKDEKTGLNILNLF